jgi:hypothetical protein
MKTIGIIGTRKRNSFIREFRKLEIVFLKYYKKGDRICSGLCKQGGDRFAVILQKKYDTNFIWHEPDYKQYGSPAAQFIRNTYIARDSDILIALVSDDRIGGTEDTIKKFIKLHGKDNLILI